MNPADLLDCIHLHYWAVKVVNSRKTTETALAILEFLKKITKQTLETQTPERLKKSEKNSDQPDVI